MDTDPEVVFPRRVSGDPLDHLPPARVPARAAIEGSRVRIEPLDWTVHAAELYEASHNSDEARRIWDYLPWGPWSERKSFESWLREQASSLDFIWYAFRTKVDGKTKGMACYLDVQPGHGVVEIGGIWFSPEMQRTRDATETLFLMMSYVMDDLAYRRLQWRCNALNERSRAAARRLGFRFEGIFYNHMVAKGRNRDTAWYSIVHEEWPKTREVFLEWLDDSNFDTNDVAQRALSEMMNGRG